MCALGARSIVGQRSARPLAASVNDQRPCGLGPILSAFSQASLAWRRVTHFLSGLSRAAQSSKQRPPKLERTILIRCGPAMAYRLFVGRQHDCAALVEVEEVERSGGEWQAARS